MVTYLFLDTEDHAFFPEPARQAIRDICDRAEPEIRMVLPQSACCWASARQASRSSLVLS